MKRVFCLILCALLCAVPNALGTEETVPKRVVSLYGSYAEAWLTAGGTLVGVTRDAVEERNLVLDDAVEIIGTTKTPNLELILALEPDLVLASADIAAQVQMCAVLEEIGIPCRMLRVDSYQDYLDMMYLFAELNDTMEAYMENTLPMRTQIGQLLESIPENARPTVLLLRAYSSGVKAKGRDNLAGIILDDLHCDNIAERGNSLEISLEAVVAQDPEYIFISTMGDEAEAKSALEASWGQNPAWQALSAVQNGHVYYLPKELFHYKPNARWGESYAYLYEILYGD